MQTRLGTTPLRPRRPDVIDEVFEGEAVLVQLRTGCYYSLNPAASHIWALLQDGRSPQTVSTAVASDIAPFCAQLLAEKLLEEAPADAPDPVGAQPLAERPELQRFTDMQDLLMLDPIHDIDVDGDGWPVTPASPG